MFGECIMEFMASMIQSLVMVDILVRLFGWYAVFVCMIGSGAGITGMLLLWVLMGIRSEWTEI